MKALLVLLEGKVQGVGMRYFIRKNAQKLGVSGYAKNLPDGKVEALLIAEEEILLNLLDTIKNHSPGNIRSINYKEIDIPSEWIGKFEIM
ncbi:MAG: acylphosphatase [Candidatus Calescibacterium sp.]|nr:acylphosphatase [Candidatus Calescibacterium sp.]MCX7971741.1 acylphosphatase [bacterium]MDW8195347.1 acylphosphatase [Candidatus Calescibacterium sp.]